ncbi:MAG: bifunctional phosphopantothenoylcysteine decarboxylase/phosphopantothenate--cysteine ligase CoaBC [Candidatus Marinimicrobia bacterium]|nr:bifunctional phosphopantothenoylcysteine decarboxylase/phosphopantothenate--cysteine ligase CoaBC [Candidatus Neomarinimicrobiota bacterium]
MHQKINSLKNKNILICVTGSIAAYKTCEIIRILKKQGSNVKVMMTKSAEKFVGKSTFAALSNNEVITDLFPDTPKAGLEHIELSFELDLVLVMPATANILSKVANGIADDVVSTTLCVCEQTTIFAPAMNYKMWQNKSVIESVDKLISMNKRIVNPESGYLASLHEGEGRLANVNTIINEIKDVFKIRLPLKNKNIIITAGPTLEPIDPVRFISNHSSGKMGYAIVDAVCNKGGNVTLLSGPVNLKPHPEANVINIKTASDLLVEFEKMDLKNVDYIFMCAAVVDYTPTKKYDKKIKRDKSSFVIDLKENPDIIKTISEKTNATIIVFALETNDGFINAKNKLKNKNADYVVLNYANKKGQGFNSNTNHVYIFDKNGIEIELRKDRKDRIAEKIVDLVIN